MFFAKFRPIDVLDVSLGKEFNVETFILNSLFCQQNSQDICY